MLLNTLNKMILVWQQRYTVAAQVHTSLVHPKKFMNMQTLTSYIRFCKDLYIPQSENAKRLLPHGSDDVSGDESAEKNQFCTQ